jgi:hypothetical protein
MGQLAFGYPASIIGVTLGQPAFLLYMGILTPEGKPASNATDLEGAMSGVFQVLPRRNLHNIPQADSIRLEPSLEFYSEATLWINGAAKPE